jgi:hypothetical protein
MRAVRYPVRVTWQETAATAERWTIERGGVGREFRSGDQVTVASASEAVLLRRATGGGLPVSFGVSQNYPNPFNPSTTVRYRLPERAQIRVRILNILGEEVARLVDDVQDAGERTARWDAGSFPSGVYFCQVVAGTLRAVVPMSLVK